MLVGSALRKTGEGWLYMSGGASIGSNPAERIEVTRHMDGSPAMHCRTIQTAADNYVLSGMTWKGNSPQGNIYIEKGKQYTFSFWAKTSAPSLVSFVLEAIWQGTRTDTSRPAGYAGPENFSKGFETTNADTWERYTQTITIPEDAEYDYVEVNIFCRAKGYTEVEAYLCRPMMEEGNEYNGWTLAEQDYDYMGGNLLDNTATLIVGNNLTVQQGTLLPGGYDGDTAYVTGSIASTADDAYVDMLQWSTDTMGMEARADYALSFMAKGEGQMTAYLYPSAEHTYAENSQGVRQEVTDGRAEFALTAEWRRYWVHWVPRANDQTGVLLRLHRPTSGTSTMYIAQPKLERGIVPTAWTERKTDLVDRATLLATGIDIVNKKITVTANTFEVRNNSGETTATVNEDGKLEVKDGIFTGKVKATEGEFTGVLKATSGTMDSITATNLDVTSGSHIGPFSLSQSGLYYETTTSTQSLRYDLYKDHFAFTDNTDYKTLFGGFEEDSKGRTTVKLSLSSETETAELKVDETAGTGLHISSTSGITDSAFRANSMHIQSEDSSGLGTSLSALASLETFDCLMGSFHGGEDLGLRLTVNRELSRLLIYLTGLPTSYASAPTGGLYVSNGYLMIKT